MNRKQRNKNRRTHKELAARIHVCANCGGRGLHWVSLSDFSLETIDDQDGFWTCPKYYDPSGRRISNEIPALLNAEALFRHLVG